jgi:hypothetical protein
MTQDELALDTAKDMLSWKTEHATIFMDVLWRRDPKLASEIVAMISDALRELNYKLGD